MNQNNELKSEVENLSNKLERCYNTKITFEHMLNNKRSYGGMSGIGFNKNMTKGERKRERKMKKQEQEKLSHSCSSNAMKWDILQMVVQIKKSSS